MKAIRICSELKSYLNRCSNEIATVHSVHKHSINILNKDGNLITVLIDKVDIQPMSVVVDTNGCVFAAIDVGDDVILSVKGISFRRCNVFIDIDKIETFDLSIDINNSEKSIEDIINACALLKDILARQTDDVGLSSLVHRILFDPVIRVDNPVEPKLNHYCDFIQERLVNLLGFIGAKNFEDALQVIPKFIGFGSGLTPSSDDVLCGMLAVIAYASRIYETQDFWADAMQFSINAYKISLGKTTLVSEQMLMHAKDGKFPKSYHGLLKSLFLKEQMSIDEVAMEVMKRGASSGKDFIFGVYCMQSIILKLWFMPHSR